MSMVVVTQEVDSGPTPESVQVAVLSAANKNVDYRSDCADDSPFPSWIVMN